MKSSAEWRCSFGCNYRCSLFHGHGAMKYLKTAGEVYAPCISTKLLAAFALIAMTSGALADDVVMLRAKDADTVIVYKNGDAADKAYALAKAKVDSPALLVQLIACVVPNGTMALIEGSWAAKRVAAFAITVVDGPKVGCRGVVTMASVRYDAEKRRYY
jgi:hypothetical protein